MNSPNFEDQYIIHLAERFPQHSICTTSTESEQRHSSNRNFGHAHSSSSFSPFLEKQKHRIDYHRLRYEQTKLMVREKREKEIFVGLVLSNCPFSCLLSTRNTGELVRRENYFVFIRATNLFFFLVGEIAI